VGVGVPMTQRRHIMRGMVHLPTGEVSDGHPVVLAATALADPEATCQRIACFAFPGGGYTRHYYDLQRPELQGPSQAEYHAHAGVVFIACDPFGGGDSTPLAPTRLDLEATARASAHACEAAVEALRSGSLVDWLGPIEVSTRVAIGHSLGGMQLIAHQARHASFDAIGILGFSAIHTQLPGAPGSAVDVLAPARTDAGTLEEAWAGPMVNEIAHLRYAYHWDDVPPTLVAADMAVGFPTRTAEVLPAWISRTFPPFAAECLAPGVVAREAAAIRVPVFVGAGQRDVVPDLQAEAAAYGLSPGVTLFELPRSAHMHNFSPQRVMLWERLQTWIDTV